MPWRQVCAQLALLAQDGTSWWSQVARDPQAVLAWDHHTLVVRWAGNAALWVDALPQGLLVRTAEEYLCLSPPGFRVVLEPAAADFPGIIRHIDDVARRFAAFRRRVMRFAHPQAGLVDFLALREPCVGAVDVLLAEGAPRVDLVLVHPQGIVSCWLVRRAESMRPASARHALVRQVTALRRELAQPQSMATLEGLLGRWPHVPGLFARKRPRRLVHAVCPEPAVLVTGFLPELRPVVAAWAEDLRSQGVPRVISVADPAHFSPRHWSLAEIDVRGGGGR
jgi:hypothetical protein